MGYFKDSAYAPKELSYFFGIFYLKKILKKIRKGCVFLFRWRCTQPHLERKLQISEFPRGCKCRLRRRVQRGCVFLFRWRSLCRRSEHNNLPLISLPTPASLCVYEFKTVLECVVLCVTYRLQKCPVKTFKNFGRFDHSQRRGRRRDHFLLELLMPLQFVNPAPANMRR